MLTKICLFAWPWQLRQIDVFHTRNAQKLDRCMPIGRQTSAAPIPMALPVVDLER
jgi:hypothetical protein